VGHFCVNCGSPLVVKTIEGRELEVCPNDSSILWHDPKVAAAVVVEHDGGIVLGRRSIEPGYGLWCLPGGFVNDDEDPAGAAVRECKEEINAEVELTGLLGVYHIPKTTASSIIGIAYRGRVAEGAAISAGPEMLEVRVFAPDSLPEIAFPSHRVVLDAYLTSPARGAEVAPLIGAGSALTLKPPSPEQEPRRPRRMW
jgi:8-oxo-dGTP diphosphatase